MDNRSFKSVLLKALGTMVLVAVIGYFVFNGFGRYPYTKEALEGQFRNAAEERNVKGNGQELLLEEEYGSSITFLLQTEDGERACATYVRSLFTEKYKEYKFYSGVTGVLAADEMEYSVNDGNMMYQLRLHFGEEPSIEQVGEVAPILYYKYVGICVIAMGVFGSRIFFRRKK